jgi:dsDNA-binding SOS-regulon protein
MKKNTLLILILGFLAGVSSTWGYFNLTTAAPAKSATTEVDDEAPEVNQPQGNANINKSQGIITATDGVVSLEKTHETDLNSVTPNSADELPLEEQVIELKQQLAKQKAAMNRILKQQRGPAAAEAALQDKFDDQIRDEEWAYKTETALRDFLFTSGMTFTPDVVVAKCKTTVCKFKLAAPADIEGFDHTQWRELDNKLIKQDFWKQFKRSSSKLDDSEFTLLLSTED